MPHVPKVLMGVVGKNHKIGRAQCFSFNNDILTCGLIFFRGLEYIRFSKEKIRERNLLLVRFGVICARGGGVSGAGGRSIPDFITP